ncbi:hypothetical protein D3C80_822440 [compost metagenome]
MKPPPLQLIFSLDAELPLQSAFQIAQHSGVGAFEFGQKLSDLARHGHAGQTVQRLLDGDGHIVEKKTIRVVRDFGAIT